MEQRNDFQWREKFNQYFWMIIVFIVSFLALVFLPLVGGPIEKIGFFFPETTAGWVIWITTKAITSALNLLIFVCFTNQGKRNVKKDPSYLKAIEILGKLKVLKEKTARSPQKFSTTIYGKKIVFIIIFTAGSTFAFEQALLGYDLHNALIYGFTIIMGLVFGLINMKTVETYWTEEFLTYAEQTKKKEEDEERERKNKEAMDLAKEDSIKQRNDTMGTNSGTDILEPVNFSGNNGTVQSMVVDSIRSDCSVLGGAVHSGSTTSDRSSATSKEVI